MSPGGGQALGLASALEERQSGKDKPNDKQAFGCTRMASLGLKQ